MDKELQILRELYNESPDHAAFRQMLEEDESLREEYRALSEVKFHLDHGRRKRPDAQVIDDIMAAAAMPPALESVRRIHDRPPQRSRVTRQIRNRLIVVFSMVLVVLGVGVWQFLPGQPDEIPMLSKEMAGFEALEDAVVEQKTTRMGNLSNRSIVSAPTNALSIANSDLDVTWDASEEVREIHRRIEMLRDRSQGLEWGSSIISVGATVNPSQDPVDWDNLHPAVQEQY